MKLKKYQTVTFVFANGDELTGQLRAAINWRGKRLGWIDLDVVLKRYEGMNIVGPIACNTTHVVRVVPAGPEDRSPFDKAADAPSE